MLVKHIELHCMHEKCLLLLLLLYAVKLVAILEALEWIVESGANSFFLYVVTLYLLLRALNQAQL